MRVFLAGATGVIGIRLVALLVGAGNEVAGMTRSDVKSAQIEALGAVPVICDVFDAVALVDAIVGFAPDLVIHQLTDLPDHLDRIPDYASRNNRIRTEGTRNLLAAGIAAGTRRFLAQSIAWTPPGSGGAVAEHERLILDAGDVVVRYGQLYGPGTYYPDDLPAPPRIHVEGAARGDHPGPPGQRRDPASLRDVDRRHLGQDLVAIVVTFRRAGEGTGRERPRRAPRPSSRTWRGATTRLVIHT